MIQSSRARPSFGRRGRVGLASGLRTRAPVSASALPAPVPDERWSPRRTLAFVVIASAGLWGLLGLIAYGGMLLVRHAVP